MHLNFHKPNCFAWRPRAVRVVVPGDEEDGGSGLCVCNLPPFIVCLAVSLQSKVFRSSSSETPRSVRNVVCLGHKL